MRSWPCYICRLHVPVAGEINTLQGNLNWIASRQTELEHPVWAGREGQLMPLCNAAESDSANLDHVAELLVSTRQEPSNILQRRGVNSTV